MLISVHLEEDEIEAIINSDVLSEDRAKRLKIKLDSERRAEARRQDEQRKEAARRAERAKNFTLTPKQAGLLAAIRAGKGAFSEPFKTYDDNWRWKYARSMGGARARMWQRLEDEGLLISGGRKLTPEGLERLQEYEKRKGEFPHE